MTLDISLAKPAGSGHGCEANEDGSRADGWAVREKGRG